MELSNATKMLSGILLITVPTIEIGGAFLLRMLKTSEHGYVDNPLRQNLFRAGHAHAGRDGDSVAHHAVVCGWTGAASWMSMMARLGAPCAAILMPLGFFLCVASPRAQKPNRLIGLVYAGAVLLAMSMLVLGVSLLRSE